MPTTPNPTSGFIIMVPKEDVIELDMEVDQALKMIISLGVVVPPWPGGKGGISRLPRRSRPRNISRLFGRLSRPDSRTGASLCALITVAPLTPI